MNVEIGDTILFETNDKKVYTGTIIDKSNKRLDLVQVTQYKENIKLNGTYSFYLPEIINIRRFPKDCSDHSIKITWNEFNELQNIRNSYVYINRTDFRYFTAIDEFKNSNEIAVAGIGLRGHRHSQKLKVLIIFNLLKVYIFDFRERSKTVFPSELREILESKLHKKVVFNGVHLNDYLVYNYNIEMQNVIDLCIFDMSIRKSTADTAPEHFASLSTCLDDYLNLVPGVVVHDDDVIKADWTRSADLAHSLKLELTEFVVYLLMLKRVMCERLMTYYE